MGMNYEDAIRDSMAKGAEAAKASAAHREADINGNGMYWYGKALEYKQMHEMAVLRENHLEAELGRRTSERNYHLRMADLLANRIRELKDSPDQRLVELEQRFMKVLDGWEEDSSSPAAISSLQFALGCVRDAMSPTTERGYHDCVECSDGKRACTCGIPADVPVAGQGVKL